MMDAVQDLKNPKGENFNAHSNVSSVSNIG
jgi:hypothetical protein